MSGEIARLEAMAGLYEASRETLLRDPPEGMEEARRGLAAIHAQYASDLRWVLALLADMRADHAENFGGKVVMSQAAFAAIVEAKG